MKANQPKPEPCKHENIFILDCYDDLSLRRIDFVVFDGETIGKELEKHAHRIKLYCYLCDKTMLANVFVLDEIIEKT